MNIDTLILQCAEDFTKCIFYYDCNPFDIESNTFMNCVKKYITPKIAFDRIFVKEA